jgi:exopolysaccharide production protein ExoQ
MHIPPIVATIIYAIGILGLFYIDRDEDLRMSKALWIPAVWLFLISSRGVSLWLGMAPAVNTPEAYVEGSPIDRAVYMVLLVAGIGVLFGRAERVGPLLRRHAPILLFFFYCAVSIAWSDFPGVAFKRWTKAVGDLVMVLIILTEPDLMGVLKQLITRLGFILFPLSVLFGKYYPNLGRRLTNSWTAEITGVTTQKNALGLICMLYGIGFLWHFVGVYQDRDRPDRRRRLLAYGTIIAMIVWLLHACNSLTSIAGLAMAGAVMWLASRTSRKPAVVHLLVVAVLGISLTALFFNPGGDLVGALGRDRPFSGRTLIWSLVLSQHTNPWVGTGFESFWLGSRLQALRDALPNFPISSAHNGYLEVYLNLGWAGVTLLALLLLTGYRSVITAFREDPPRGSLLLGLFLATLFEGFTEAAFRMMSPAWIFLLLTIIAASQVVALEAVAQPWNEPAECAQWSGAESIAGKWEWSDESELPISPR